MIAGATGPDEATAAHQRDLPGLDGIRAIAVCLVISCHSPNDFASGTPLRRIADHGQFGVPIFFVLSGYLITYLLLREEARVGRIGLGRFYMRRVIRIIPPMYALVAVSVVFAWLGWITLTPLALAGELLFFANLVPVPMVTGHLWSLAIEEQFYLAWPLVFLACRNPRWRAWVVGSALALMPLWRWLTMWRVGTSEIYLPIRDAILTGCLLALATKLPSWERCLGSRAMRHSATSCVAVAALVGTFTPTYAAIPKIGVVSSLLQSLCVAIVINQVVRAPGGWLTRGLSLAPIAWIGRLSYSLYLWHTLFCAAVWPEVESRFLHLPWSLAPTLATAMLSYYVIEKPLFRLRARFRPVRPQPGPIVPSPLRPPAIQPSGEASTEVGRDRG